MKPWIVLFLGVLPLMAADAVLLSKKTSQAPPLEPNPTAAIWKKAPLVLAERDRFGKPLPEARTEIRSLWTPDNLYLLFTANYQTMYLRPQPQLDQETFGLWDFDVVEVFIGDDLERIWLYKEFEVSPRGEWVDLDVDKKRKDKMADWTWNSGFRFKTRVDQAAKQWHCVMEIPWKSIAAKAPAAGMEYRLNLYRIEGGPKDRKYITWQPVNNPSFHTPEAFGRLRLTK